MPQPTPKNIVVDTNIFPVNMTPLLMPEDFWPEPKGDGTNKWTDDIYVGTPNGVQKVSIRDIIKAKYGPNAYFAGLDFVKGVVGVQIIIGMDIESLPGNQFADVTYVEKAMGG